MNLLELMLKNEIEWPVGAAFAVQDDDGEMVKFGCGRTPILCNTGIWHRDVEVSAAPMQCQASDWSTSIITREQYQAAGGKIAAPSDYVAPSSSASDAATAKQATPKGSGNPILGMVLADLTNRALEGAAKYGEPLKARNGRNPLWDAYQEALDLAMYLRQAIEEQR